MVQLHAAFSLVHLLYNTNTISVSMNFWNEGCRATITHQEWIDCASNIYQFDEDLLAAVT